MPPQLFHNNRQDTIFHAPKELKTPYLVSLLLICATALLSLMLYSVFPPVVPLFYSLSEHSQQLAPKIWLLFIPAWSFVIFFTNLFLAKWLKPLDVTYAQILSWVTTVLLCMLLFQLLRLWIIL